MFRWRITKYDPQYRDKSGAYLKDEWIDYGEIGQTFEGKEFTLDDYLKTEEAYIQAALLFMEDLNVTSLRISRLISNSRTRKKVTTDDKIELVNNTYVNKERIVYIIKLVLRHKVGCKLITNDMYIDFGGSSYMYIGSTNRPSDSTIEKIKKLGLFVEEYGLVPLWLNR